MESNLKGIETLGYQFGRCSEEDAEIMSDLLLSAATLAGGKITARTPEQYAWTRGVNKGSASAANA